MKLATQYPFFHWKRSYGVPLPPEFAQDWWLDNKHNEFRSPRPRILNPLEPTLFPARRGGFRRRTK